MSSREIVERLRQRYGYGPAQAWKILWRWERTHRLPINSIGDLHRLYRWCDGR